MYTVLHSASRHTTHTTLADAKAAARKTLGVTRLATALGTWRGVEVTGRCGDAEPAECRSVHCYATRAEAKGATDDHGVIIVQWPAAGVAAGESVRIVDGDDVSDGVVVACTVDGVVVAWDDHTRTIVPYSMLA